MFDRDRLQKIRDEANYLAICSGASNRHWQRAYAQLADAADRLDAMLARTGDPTPVEEVVKIEVAKIEVCKQCSGKGRVRCWIVQDESVVIDCPECKGEGSWKY